MPFAAPRMETHDAEMNVYTNRFAEQVETVTTKTLLESWQSISAKCVMSLGPLRISCNSSCRRKPAKSGPYKQATALPCREARELRANSDCADALHRRATLCGGTVPE